jgi:nucleoredoxin
MKRMHILTIACAILFSAGAMQAAGPELPEAERRRLDAAKGAHAQEVERAALAFRAAVTRANANIERAYLNVIRGYERKGDEQTVAALHAELEEIQSKQDLPPVAEPGHVRMIEAIGPAMVRADGGPVPSTSIADKEYVMLYFSASWCGPCRAFTPSLVEFYDNKRGGGKFELIFVSSDRSPVDMQKYMNEYRMAFPAIPFNRIDPSGIKGAYGGRGIPHLVIVGRDGDVISSSYVDGQYVGPRKVLADMEQLLAAAN